MAEFKIEDKIRPVENSNDYSGKQIDNIKKIRAGDGSFTIERGRIELRDTSGNIVVLLDANG